ncbi:hypothetical protein IQ07DRAFT_309794 [Pyrenochaeta sp. DS3sAY3a]|nr:hypothetical protein IQ07DRAFT_309794 [Pyrenochaeta sp. DS3sAY3a]
MLPRCQAFRRPPKVLLNTWCKATQVRTTPVLEFHDSSGLMSTTASFRRRARLSGFSLNSGRPSPADADTAPIESRSQRNVQGVKAPALAKSSLAHSGPPVIGVDASAKVGQRFRDGKGSHMGNPWAIHGAVLKEFIGSMMPCRGCASLPSDFVAFDRG